MVILSRAVMRRGKPHRSAYGGGEDHGGPFGHSA